MSQLKHTPGPITTEIHWHKPTDKLPDFNTPILAAVESSVDRGQGFVRTLTIYTIKIMMADAAGDRTDALVTSAEIISGDTDWDDAQFMCVEPIVDEELDFYSDSIVLWAELPTLPIGGDDASS